MPLILLLFNIALETPSRESRKEKVIQIIKENVTLSLFEVDRIIFISMYIYINIYEQKDY
jgi:hypothetical protein